AADRNADMIDHSALQIETERAADSSYFVPKAASAKGFAFPPQRKDTRRTLAFPLLAAVAGPRRNCAPRFDDKERLMGRCLVGHGHASALILGSPVWA